MRLQFKNTLLRLAERDSSLALILGDVSVYLFNEFQQRYPDRFYNLGICENTIISVGAGLSALGFTPFMHTIAPFLTERCYEHIKLDVCYNNFPANLVTCGASYDYAWDGASHHCYTDLAILRLLPGMDVFQPGSRKELDLLMTQRYDKRRPAYYRLSDNPHGVDLPVEYGKGVALANNGAGLTVMTAGPILGEVLSAVEGLPVNLVYFHTIKPLDEELVAAFRHTDILVVHDAFGLFEAVTAVGGVKASFHGMPDEFCGCYGRLGDIRRHTGLDRDSIRDHIKNRLAESGGS